MARKTASLKFAALGMLLVAAAQAESSPGPKVTAVDGTIQAGDLIDVHVEHLSEWVSVTNDPGKLIPYINGLALLGNYPDAIDTSRSQVHFHFRITPENKERWVDLLGASTGVRRPVTFTVGLEKQSPFDTVFDRGNRLPLIVVDTFYGVVALLVVLVTLIVFFRLARKTNLIRDAAAETDVVGTLKPFNLGRAQMAFWFLLICISYVVIWLVTGALDTINASLLGLMGISAGTALSEAMIDSDKEAKKDKTGDQVAAVPDLVPVIGPPVPPARSHGFLRDILSGGADYSFHRFQIWVWTMVLGVIFISDVYNSLSMPTFSTTLLGLMGISSGTFIGFKFPEKK